MDRAKPGGSGNRHFTHGTSASTADMAVEGEPAHHDKPAETPHARQITPPRSPNRKVDHLADKVKKAGSRREALIDESIEETFPASDPPSAKHIT
jgi:hypothetical protein